MAVDAQPLYVLTATEALARLRVGTLTVEAYATALLDRIAARDAHVRAWAYLDPAAVLQQARALDKVPMDQRGPLHGLPIGVKDVIYTRGKLSIGLVNLPPMVNWNLHCQDAQTNMAHPLFM
jgi:Asp-tRNA(Asn)/Glu-tRNA(Gln) amidotransferase A subunit family amidase